MIVFYMTSYIYFSFSSESSVSKSKTCLLDYNELLNNGTLSLILEKKENETNQLCNDVKNIDEYASHKKYYENYIDSELNRMNEDINECINIKHSNLKFYIINRVRYHKENNIQYIKSLIDKVLVPLKNMWINNESYIRKDLINAFNDYFYKRQLLREIYQKKKNKGNVESKDKLLNEITKNVENINIVKSDCRSYNSDPKNDELNVPVVDETHFSSNAESIVDKKRYVKEKFEDKEKKDDNTNLDSTIFLSKNTSEINEDIKNIGDKDDQELKNSEVMLDRVIDFLDIERGENSKSKKEILMFLSDKNLKKYENKTNDDSNDSINVRCNEIFISKENEIQNVKGEDENINEISVITVVEKDEDTKLVDGTMITEFQEEKNICPSDDQIYTHEEDQNLNFSTHKKMFKAIEDAHYKINTVLQEYYNYLYSYVENSNKLISDTLDNIVFTNVEEDSKLAKDCLSDTLFEINHSLVKFIKKVEMDLLLHLLD